MYQETHVTFRRGSWVLVLAFLPWPTNFRESSYSCLPRAEILNPRGQIQLNVSSKDPDSGSWAYRAELHPPAL